MFFRERCAEDEKTRDLVHQYKGPQRLALLLSKPHNKQLLCAATGAIWKCSLSRKNVTKFQEVGVLQKLVSLLSEQPEEVLVNVVAALGEFAHIASNRTVIGQSGGIEKLVRLLTGRNQTLLVNVTRTLGICASDMKNMVIMDQLDGLRLVWSLLKHPSAEVQASAAWALCPVIHHGKDVDESMRRLIGGFQLLIKLLESTDNEVLASICAVIAKITEDKEENVALLTDYGVVPLLAKLTGTTDDRLRRHLAEAIAYCCMWSQNRGAFGRAGAVPPLVSYVRSNNQSVHETTVVGLYQLSKDVDNCVSLHGNGAVKPLLELMGHPQEDVAFMAAGCVRNIRMLANANKFHKMDDTRVSPSADPRVFTLRVFHQAFTLRVIRQVFALRVFRQVFALRKFRLVLTLRVFRQVFTLRVFRQGFTLRVFRQGFTLRVFRQGFALRVFCQVFALRVFRQGFTLRVFRQVFALRNFRLVFTLRVFRQVFTLRVFRQVFTLRVFRLVFTVRAFCQVFALRVFRQVFALRVFRQVFTVRVFCKVFTVRVFCQVFIVRVFRRVFTVRVFRQVFTVWVSLSSGLHCMGVSFIRSSL
uniref:Armadillo repeat-containing protein 4 n=1 Tax=Knipowitschia caucasica TaxID=637954 RepID=A0AAV2JU82_KNICA